MLGINFDLDQIVTITRGAWMAWIAAAYLLGVVMQIAVNRLLQWSEGRHNSRRSREARVRERLQRYVVVVDR